MKRIEILINGKAYPCQQTAGAMLRFKEVTGKEVTEMEPGSLSDLIKFLWCCVAGACKREGKELEYSLMDFADAIGPEELASWQEELAEEQKNGKEEGSKKKTRQSRKS